MALADQLAQGYQFAAPQDPFAQYGKMQQLQQGQQANQLNQMKMAEYQRAAEETNALRQLDRSSPDYVNQLYRINPTQGLAYEKSQAESKNLALTGRKTEAEIANLGVTGKKTQSDIDKEKLDRQLKIAEVAGSVLNGVVDQATYDQAKRALSHIVPSESLADYPTTYDPKFIASEKAMGQTFTQRLASENAARVAATGERTAATSERQATTSEGNLAFQKQKFNWEKSNPGHELIQNADGEYYAVDKRTKAMTPLMVGGAAPAAAVPMGGGQGARGVPGVAPAGGVPVGRATAPAGVPFVGKSAALTESQSNAALFGSGMAQAQNVLAQASKKGVDTAPVTTSVVQGLVKYVPFGVGDKLVQDVMSVAQQDPTKLFGPDAEQQKVGQAQLAFAIAYLRKTSGANFGQSELVNTMNEFFPSIGEDKSMIQQKAKARERVVEGMRLAAGSQGSKFIKQYQGEDSGTSATSANDPLGLRK